MVITFNELPEIVGRLFMMVEGIQRQLSQQGKQLPETALWFDLDQLCEYHPDKPAKPTVYGWISKDAIPYHKSGKKLRFLKSEIDLWLLKGQKKTVAESANDVDTFLSNVASKRRLKNGK